MCVSSWWHLPHLQHPNLSNQSDLDETEDAIDNELRSLSNHSLVKVKGIEVIEASGPSNINYAPGPFAGQQGKGGQPELPSHNTCCKGEFLWGSNQKGCWAGGFT